MIVNPLTGHKVKRDGKIGKIIVATYKKCQEEHAAKEQEKNLARDHAKKVREDRKKRAEKAAVEAANKGMSTVFADKVDDLASRYLPKKLTTNAPRKTVDQSPRINILIPRRK
jgi:hypothetical protein